MLAIFNKRDMFDEHPEEKVIEPGNVALVSCCNELLEAIHNNDPEALAEAFKNAFQVVELEPHEEYQEHEEEYE